MQAAAERAGAPHALVARIQAARGGRLSLNECMVACSEEYSVGSAHHKFDRRDFRNYLGLFPETFRLIESRDDGRAGGDNFLELRAVHETDAAAHATRAELWRTLCRGGASFLPKESWPPRLARPELLPELRELLATAPPEGLPLAQLAVELRLRLHLPRLVFVLNLKSYLNLFPDEFRVQRDNAKDRKPIDMVRLVR